MRLFSGLLVVALMISATAGAQSRENHCDHSNGKAGGTVVGGILGGVLGGVLGHGKAAPIAGGAVGGAILGRVAGDGIDDDNDWKDCGTDSESFQRGVDRDVRADEARNARRQQTQDEIAYDREQSRRGRGYPGRGYPPPRPRYERFQCQAVEGRHHRIVEFVVVDLRTGYAVQHRGLDQYGCQNAADRLNGY